MSVRCIRAGRPPRSPYAVYPCWLFAAATRPHPTKKGGLMISRSRRVFLAQAAAVLAAPRAFAQQQDSSLFSHLRREGPAELPPEAQLQRVFDSPAQRAAQMGRWETRAPLLLPRSEMAWATAWGGRAYLIGGYGRQSVDRPYNHAYDAASDKWLELAPLPRGANHVAVVATDGKVYALGGHTEQNRTPHDECFAYDIAANRWSRIAPLPRPSGGGSAVAVGGKVHLIGGAFGGKDRRSIDWHWAYDPKADRWEDRAPIPRARDHMGAVVIGELIHVVAGRVNTFASNVGDHDVYDPKSEQWSKRAPLPTPRSGHGAVLLRGRIFVMGGEQTGKVFGQNESYDPNSDSWQQHAPMLTPRHGLGAAAVGDWIYVMGGGPVVGGSIQSAINEAFTPG
jgi:N-acetylneuraminic acid mutarotase